MARVPAGMFEMATAAPMSSETMTPPKPYVSRRRFITVGENTARCAGSIFLYRASATMTIGTPASMACRNEARSGSSGVVTESTTFAVKSVLPITRPRPGKCFAVVVTPALAIPCKKATPWAPTVAGSFPYSRLRTPIG